MRLARERAYALASLADAPDAPDRCIGKPTTTSTTSCVTTSPAIRSRSLLSLARRTVSRGLARVPVVSERARPTRTFPTSTPIRRPGTQRCDSPSAPTIGAVLTILRPVGAVVAPGHARRVTPQVQDPRLVRGRLPRLRRPVGGCLRRHGRGHRRASGLGDRLVPGGRAHAPVPPIACSAAA